MAIKTIAQLKSDVNTNITQNVGTRGITAPILGGEMIDTIDSLSAVDESLEERKANIDGSYDTMTVGLAKNLEGDIYVEGKTYFKPTATVVDDEGAFTSEEVGSGSATIETISGNTVVWNQLYIKTTSWALSTGSADGLTISVDSDGYLNITGTATTSTAVVKWVCNKSIPPNHKLYYHMDGWHDGIYWARGGFAGYTAPSFIHSYNQSWPVFAHVYCRLNEPITLKARIYAVDLTLMFGYGNEPSTVEEFEDWLSKNVGLAPYYAYNAGTLINAKPTGMASIGYNLMELEGSTGTARVPGTYDDGLYGSYYGIRGTYSSVSFVPAATGVSETITPDSDGKFEITRPGDIVVSGAGSSTTVFMWYDGSYTKDSVEYEYTPTTGLDVTKIYGKANGSSTYTQVFPDGIKSINGIRDILDLKNGEATVKIGIFPNLGTLNWSSYSNNRFYSNGLDALVVSASTIFCTIYPSGSPAFDRCIYVASGAGRTEIRDTTIEQSTAGANAIKASLANVKGYYVCLNPITYTELIVSNDGGQTGVPVQVFNYTVDNWGLEELLPQNDYATANGIVTTAPILNVRYSIDAVEVINTINDQISDLYENKANITGEYPELSVGMAENLKGKKSEDSCYTSRTAGGDAEIANGVANVIGVNGNTVKYNQMLKNPNFNNGTYWILGSGSGGIDTSKHYITLYNDTATDNTDCKQSLSTQMIVGHKYYVYAKATSRRVGTVGCTFYGGGSYPSETIGSIQANETKEFRKIFEWSNNRGNNYTTFGFSIRGRGADYTLYGGIRLFDLTEMFGSGNEPSSETIFEQWLIDNVGGKKYYEYSKGKLLPANVTGLKTVGFNLFDDSILENYSDIEKTANGWRSTVAKWYSSHITFFDNTQLHYPDELCLSINVTEYGGDSTLYFKVIYTDGTQTAFPNRGIQSSGKFTETTAAGKTVDYITMGYGNGGSVYITLEDICINLSWDGSYDGEYESYDENEYPLDITNIYGVPTGQTEAVQVFPTGMKKINDDIYDELDLVNAEAYVRVIDFNLGEMNWTPISSSAKDGYSFQSAEVATGAKKGWQTLFKCATYPTFYGVNSTMDDYASINSVPNLFINDTSFENSSTGAANLKTSLNGVHLYSAREEDIHYTNLVYRDPNTQQDTPVKQLNIVVNNWGTEEEILTEDDPTTGLPTSCSAEISTIYGIDAVEQLDTIANEGIDIYSMKTNLESLCTALNTYCSTVLGGTFSISNNPNDKTYAIGFTPNPQQS